MKLKSFVLKALMLMLCLIMVLSSCTGRDAVDADGDNSVADSIADSLDESEETTKKSNAPSVTADRDYIKFKNPWTKGITVEAADGKEISLRKVTIDIAGNGTPINIFQITDPHFNYRNSEDMNDASVTASYNAWGSFTDHNTVIETFQRCVGYANSQNAKQIVVTGDIANYYSRGNLEEMERYIFSAQNNIMAVGGNHSVTLAGYNQNQMLSQYNALANLYTKYGQNLSYFSRVIDSRVMLIQMDNATLYDAKRERFTAEQLASLKEDLATARASGYTVLLFYHIPLPSKNTADSMNTYDIDAYKSGTSKEVYDLITSNADIIKGCFAGHTHVDSYSELVATTAEGKKAFVPQYVLEAMCLSDGAMVQITLQ